jgi:hypothetical protein
VSFRSQEDFGANPAQGGDSPFGPSVCSNALNQRTRHHQAGVRFGQVPEAPAALFEARNHKVFQFIRGISYIPIQKRLLTLPAKALWFGKAALSLTKQLFLS